MGYGHHDQRYKLEEGRFLETPEIESHPHH